MKNTYKKMLLGININGVKKLKDFKISFLAKENKNEDEKDDDLIKVFENNEDIYLNKINFIHGKNASGKTTLLKLINVVDSLSNLNNSRNKYRNDDFNFLAESNETINIIAYYAMNKYLIKHDITLKTDNKHFDTIALNGLNLNKEIISIFNIENNKKNNTNLLQEEIIGKDEKIQFQEIYKFSDYKVYRNSIKNEILSGLPRWISFPEEIINFFIQDMQNKENNIEIKRCNKLLLEALSPRIETVIPQGEPHKQNIKVAMQYFEKETLSFVSIFDEQVKELKFQKSLDLFTIIFKDGKKIRTQNLNPFLSSGTLRGMVLLAMIKDSFSKGTDIYLDEIESNFNNRIVMFIIDLFANNKINKNGSRLFATTHYLKTLDKIKRRDSIFLTQWDKVGLKLKLLSDFDEIKEVKSKRSISNTKLIDRITEFDITLGLEDSYYFNEKFKK